MKKGQRKTQAEETMAICEAGCYRSFNGIVVDIAHAVQRAKDGTRCYDLATMPSMPVAASIQVPFIEVTNETTFVALARLHDAGAAAMGCLNFASAKNPGGGFLNGAEAQEEALSRASALVPCLMTQFDSLYIRNRGHGSSIYLDLAIVSPGVPFFRNDEGLLLDSVVPATVITSPAPNAGAVAFNEPDKVNEIVPALRRRSEQVLRAAALAGVQTLVLGAWGCGVFRNEPAAVAGAFAELLLPGRCYHHHFRQIIFAVFDRTPDLEKVRAFKDAFSMTALPMNEPAVA